MRVLDRNLRSFEQQPDRAAFCKPGFEMDQTADKTDTARYFHLRSHDLQSLLAKHTQGEPLWPVDARARIEVAREQFKPTMNLVDLEHARMHDTMLPRPAGSPDATPVLRAASLHWASPAGFWLTGLLPQFQRFRHDPLPRVDVVFLPDEEEEGLQLHRVVDGPRRGEKLHVLVDKSLLSPERLSFTGAESVTPWGQVDLLQELVALAESKGLSLQACAARYATASLPEQPQGWRFHAFLGLAAKR